MPLCNMHQHGRAPGIAYAYSPDCDECVARRSHLPPEERDIPWLTRTQAMARQIRCHERELFAKARHGA